MRTLNNFRCYCVSRNLYTRLDTETKRSIKSKPGMRYYPYSRAGFLPDTRALAPAVIPSNDKTNINDWVTNVRG